MKVIDMSNMREQLKSSQPYVDVDIVKQILFKIESFLGHTFYRRPPPRRVARPHLLNLGCGAKKYDGWVNADFYNFHDLLGNRDFVPDWMLDITKPMRCEDAHWDGVFTEHTIEHLSYDGCFFAFTETYRTMRPGAWLRVVVPDIEKYISYYIGKPVDEQFKQFPRGPQAISNIAQGWGHKSIWDSRLLSGVLLDIGYINVRKTSFGEGSDPRIIKDSQSRAWESLYIEAQRAQ